MSQDSRKIKLVADLVRSGHLDAFVKAARELEPADLGDILSSLDEADRLTAVRALPTELSGEALWEMPEETHAEETLAALRPEQAADIVEGLADDDAADLLGQMDPHTAERILAQVEVEQQSDVRRLMQYDEDSVGGLMTAQVVTVLEGASASEAIDTIRRQVVEEGEQFIQVYVTDREERLLGVVALKELIINPPTRPVREFMEDADIRIHPEEPKQQVAELISRYNLLEVPVVDGNGKLMGRVTFDDVIDVVEAEQTKDILKFGGIGDVESSYSRAGAWEMVKKRAGWLLVLFLSEMLTTTAMGHFQHELERAVVLALFIPLIISSGGNSGSQATSLIIRAMALGEVTLRDWWRVAAREIPSGLLLGAILGSVGFLRIATWQWLGLYDYGVHHWLVASTIFCALVGVVMFGSLAGSMLPFVLKRFGFDPASASAPFVATLVDVTGIVIYFTVAAVMLTGTLL
ncbi:MAG TPA: magnesium transporter [Gemmatimonadales bacterium]|nr:magnesium transporter [Gemmatimonadales bacterium]